MSGRSVNAGYVYIWEYTIRTEHLHEFLAAYRPDGRWAQLFRKAAGYIGTELLRDQTDPARFITIDRWASRSAFDSFLAEHRIEFEVLDKECEAFTREEELIGKFSNES